MTARDQVAWKHPVPHLDYLDHGRVHLEVRDRTSRLEVRVLFNNAPLFHENVRDVTREQGRQRAIEELRRARDEINAALAALAPPCVEGKPGCSGPVMGGGSGEPFYYCTCPAGQAEWAKDKEKLATVGRR